MRVKPTASGMPAALDGLLGRAFARPQADVHAANPTVIRGTARSKLWQLDRKFHCLIVGTCISAAEIAKIARRFGFAAPSGDDYRQHVEAVGRCDSRNEVSQALQRHLDQRYAAALHDFAPHRDEAAVLEHWNTCQARGDIAGPLWAAVTHKHAGDEVRSAAYAAVHMLSHQVGAGLAADVRRLGFLEQDNIRLRLELAAGKAALAQRAELSSGEHAALKRELDTLRDERTPLLRDRERLAKLENGVTMITLSRRLLALTDENRALQVAAARSDALSERAERLQRELESGRRETTRLQAEREALEKLLLGAATAIANQDGEAGAEPAQSAPPAGAGSGDCLRCAEEHGGLARARCILCVGGRTALLSHYRALAERLGIRLIHHDGGQEEALSRLPEMIASADAVLCPTDCVGHAAYYSLKQHCRKTGKPCLLFKGAGVTSFAFALSRLSAGESSLPTDSGGNFQKTPSAAA